MTNVLIKGPPSSRTSRVQEFKIDPNYREGLTRGTINEINKCIKQAISQKKTINVTISPE